MNFEKYTHDDLIELGRIWLSKPYGQGHAYSRSACKVIITELSTDSLEVPDILGFTSHTSILIECKTSLSDFNADKNKPFRKNGWLGVGVQRFYLSPAGLITKDKIPFGWGLLEAAPNKKIKVIVNSEPHERNFQHEIEILLSVLCRLNVLDDGHVAIKKYTTNIGAAPSKKKATFYLTK